MGNTEQGMPGHAMGNTERGMPRRRLDYIYTIIAVLFLALSFFLIGAFGWVIVHEKALPVRPVWCLSFAVLAAGLGVLLLHSVRLAGKEVVPPEVKPFLLKSSDPVGDYVRLCRLIGGTAFFGKLGFTGMPLATILMTLVLCLLSIGSYLLNRYTQTGQTEMIPKEVATGFFELAKLTLGAFIGSFVTKGRASEEAPPANT